MSTTTLHDRVQHLRQQRTTMLGKRVVRAISQGDGIRVKVNDRWLTDFSSNNYLGLARQFEVINALQEAAASEGAGSTSPYLGGYFTSHEALEQEVADWLNYPQAVLLSNTFLANLAIQQTLLSEDDFCVQDQLNHPSFLDASRLAGCRLLHYPHADSEGALRQLKQVKKNAVMLATEGVFGLDGDVAPLKELVMVARLQQALIYVDDSHGLGVVGKGGNGCVAQADLSINEIPLQLVSLDKAIGTYGAVVVGEPSVIEYLKESARPYLYSATLPPVLAKASLVAVKLARRDHWRREKLNELIALFCAGAKRYGLELLPSETPIQTMLCGSHDKTTAMAEALEKKGFLVGIITTPRVPEGKERIRVALSTLHTPSQITTLLEVMAKTRDGAL